MTVLPKPVLVLKENGQGKWRVPGSSQTPSRKTVRCIPATLRSANQTPQSPAGAGSALSEQNNLAPVSGKTAPGLSRSHVHEPANNGHQQRGELCSEECLSQAPLSLQSAAMRKTHIPHRAAVNKRLLLGWEMRRGDWMPQNHVLATCSHWRPHTLGFKGKDVMVSMSRAMTT